MSTSKKAVTSLIKTESIKDLNQYIHDRQHEVEQWKEYWKVKQEEYFEEKFETSSPSVVEVNEIRRFLHQYLQKKLADIEAYEDDEMKRRALQFVLPFNTDEGISDFLIHFFQLESKNEKLEYVFRDPYEKEVHILYDIYKIKKTMECIDVMRKTLGNSEKTFPSQFSEQEKKEILEPLREVLKVLFRFTIKNEFQKEIYQQISMDYIGPKAILERREKELFYSYDHVIEKYDYRNLFFLIYFRDGLSAKVGGEQKTYHYSYMNFEILKQEYLTHWLESRLKNNPEKEKVYNSYEIDNRTISSWLEEDPSLEMELLKKLPANKFNNLIAKIDENVDDDLKTEMSSMSESEGEVAEFKKNTEKASSFVKSPLDKLKSFLGMKKKEETTLTEESIETTTKPEEEEEPEPEWKIASLQAKQVPYFYLCQSASKYKGALGLVRVKLGGEFQNLTKLVTKLMNAFGENGVIRRRTPKHDWTVPYMLKYVKGKTSTDYLLILGGEAKIKAKGMGYSSGDEYSYTPYVVFATAEPDEQYGDLVAERPVAGKTFQEYSLANNNVRTKVVEFMDMIQEKEFPGEKL